MKKIMILAGGNDQAALIRELKHHYGGEVETILLDMNANVPAHDVCDRFLPVSTMDRKAVLEAAKNEKFDFILTACGDQPLSTMAYVSAQLGLPSYLTEEDVRNLTDKVFMKQMMVNHDIPTARHFVDNGTIDRNELLEKVSRLTFPIVVKPNDSNGSKGVKKVTDINDFFHYYDEAMSYSLSKQVIVEEFKQGTELSVDVYVEGTEAKLLSITTSNKIKSNSDSFTILQSVYPPRVKYEEAKVREIAQKISVAFGLHDTPLLVQMIVDEQGNYNVIEFSARMGGGSKYRFIQAVSGVNIMRVYVDMVLGNKPHVDPVQQYHNATMSYVYSYPGIYESIQGLDELKAQGLILDYFIYKMPHTEITKSNTSSDRVAGFLIVGDSESEVDDKLRQVNGLLKVLDPDGKDIMRHDFFE